MPDTETFRFTFDGDTIVSASVVEDGDTEPFTLEPGEELVRLGAGVVFFEPQERSGWEWTLFMEAEPGVWVERADGHGRITAEQVALIAAHDLEDGDDDEGDGEGEGEGDGDGGDGDDEGPDDDDVDGDGEGDGLVGGDRYRFAFDEEGAVSAVWEVEDGEEEEESISPDESYTVVGDYIVKSESEREGVEWEIYARVIDSDDWVEVASGFGDAAPTSPEAIADAIFNEDGVAEDIEGDDDDRFEGGEDDDEFESLGDDGDDDYIGGGGRDRIRFEGEDGVRVDLRIKDHQETGRGFDRVVDVEDLDGSDGDDVLTGDFLGNSLRGDDGDDVQNGNGGDDDLWGDLGDDSLIGGGGRDTMSGGHGHDDIDAGTGNDTAMGGFGDDDVDGQDGDDKLDGNSGRDDLDGGAGADSLAGGDDSDMLWGGSGNDVLRGGRGADQLSGGAGRDVFVFKTVAEGGLGRFDDVITDFVRGQDRIDLRDFDLDYIGRARFEGDGDAQLRLEGFTGGVRLIADVDGNGTADFSMEVNGVSFLSVADLML
jgi:Ca2+-binding RTX toxin-like protein